jgi:hypothetical protein
VLCFIRLPTHQPNPISPLQEPETPYCIFFGLQLIEAPTYNGAMTEAEPQGLANVDAMEANKKLAPIFCLDLKNQLDLQNLHVEAKLYASVSILDPVITIERHGGKYHIAARFNIETTILDYHSRKRSGHTLAILLDTVLIC